MFNIRFLNESKKYLRQANVKVINNNVVEISGVDKNLSGFYILDKNNNIFGDYSNYTNLYREIKGGYQLSNDGSVYIEPEPIPPYVPILEDVKYQKIQEISNICNQTITNGIDVKLSNGEINHYSLKTEDQINLFNRQIQIANGLDKFEYHADGEPCVYYTKDDMQKIIDETTKFISYHTTYCNSMFNWIKSLSDKIEVDIINYGDAIPEQYQSDVLKDYMKNK